jgi:hypothetical protein
MSLSHLKIVQSRAKVPRDIVPRPLDRQKQTDPSIVRHPAFDILTCVSAAGPRGPVRPNACRSTRAPLPLLSHIDFPPGLCRGASCAQTADRPRITIDRSSGVSPPYHT